MNKRVSFRSGIAKVLALAAALFTCAMPAAAQQAR